MTASEAILEAYATLRVADVRDGMDVLMYHDRGSFSPDIRPLWRTRAFGIAKTVKYVPYQGTIPRLNEQEYQEWSGMYYREICPYPWMEEIQPGDFVVIDQSGVDAGLMGSENTLTATRKGARGFVSNAGVRDTDEIILQQIPFWSRFISQGMVQGRLQYHSHDSPVEVGRVTVAPGDVIVADGDGVICVPRSIAMDVARLAGEEHERDMAKRRSHYVAMGRSLDGTVKG